MWIMTSFGILMPALRPAHTIYAGDDRTMQIRTRRAKDLDILRARYMQGTLGPNLYTPDKDYEYRAYCTPHAFALAMAQMVVEIDYGKFKPTTEKQYEDRELHDCYNAIWAMVLNRLSSYQHRTEYWHSQRPYTPNKRGSRRGSSGWVDHPGYALPGSSGTSYGSPTGPAAIGSPWPTNGRRNTSADRDQYEPDPAMQLDHDEPQRTGRDDLDALYDEIDELLTRDLKPLDHSGCDHAQTNNARARCRRKQRRAESARVEEIRRLIDESYADSAEPVHGEVVGG